MGKGAVQGRRNLSRQIPGLVGAMAASGRVLWEKRLSWQPRGGRLPREKRLSWQPWGGRV
jgi:hypothetical protein